jgi:hypothetical protein
MIMRLAPAVKNLFKYELLRRYLISNLSRAGLLILLVILWCYFLQNRHSGIALVFALTVFLGAAQGILRTLRCTGRLISAQVQQINEISLKVSNGSVTEKHSLPCSVHGRCMLFFESSRNLIEGKITLRQVTASVTMEAPLRLKPGWRKIARRSDITPVEFEIDGAESLEVYVDFDLHIFNRNLFRPNLQESENVLVLLMNEAK